jgi:5-methylcytosine-specific restriction protein A
MGEVQRIRGYTLQKRNARLMRREPLCRPCRKLKRYTAATQIDHIVPLSRGGTEDEGNLQPICDDCHDKKTIIDLNLHTWPIVGADGWPVKEGRREPRHRYHKKGQ